MGSRFADENAQTYSGIFVMLSTGLVSAAVQNPYFLRMRNLVQHVHLNSFQYLMLETSVSPTERFPDESHTSLILFLT